MKEIKEIQIKYKREVWKINAHLVHHKIILAAQKNWWMCII
jgi:hypothetical protein